MLHIWQTTQQLAYAIVKDLTRYSHKVLHLRVHLYFQILISPANVLAPPYSGMLRFTAESGARTNSRLAAAESLPPRDASKAAKACGVPSPPVTPP